jgi:hypothetical protein
VLYPNQVIEEFTELFWQRIQLWRQREKDTSRFPRGAS